MNKDYNDVVVDKKSNYNFAKDVLRFKDFLALSRHLKLNTDPDSIDPENVKVHDESEEAKENVKYTSNMAHLPAKKPAIGDEHDPPEQYQSLDQLNALGHPLTAHKMYGSEYAQYGQQDLDLDKVTDSTESSPDLIHTPPYGHTMDSENEHARRRKIDYRVHENLQERQGTATYSTERPLGAEKGDWRRHVSDFITFSDDFTDDLEDKFEDIEKIPETHPMVQFNPTIAQPSFPTAQFSQIVKPMKTFAPILQQSAFDGVDFDNVLSEADATDNEKDLNGLADKINDVDDILHLYEPHELMLVDPETGVSQHLDGAPVNEALSRTERVRIGMRFARSESRRERKLQIALKRHSDPKTLNKRARQLAIRLLKQRLIHKASDEMTVVEKERVEQMLAQRKTLVDKLAIKLVPRIRQIEKQRLTHPSVTQGRQ